MDAKKLYERVCATQEADVRRFWGRIQEAEKESCGRGMISRFYSGSREILLKPLLQFLCALGVHPAGFFARALGVPLNAEVLLADLIVDHRGGDRLWREIETATRQLERRGDLEIEQHRGEPPADVEALVESMAGASRREQLRRMRDTRRYRTPAFVRAYLRHLDSLRDEEPDLACRQAARVAIHLIPATPGPARERIGLQCEALGIFGSAMRLQAEFSTAARALFLALQLAERHQLPAIKGQLLSRSAHLLENTGHGDLALIALREALEIYLHSDSMVGIGKTLIVQGRIFCCIEKHEKAIEVLTAGLRHLPEEPPELARYHFSAYQALAEAHQGLGNLQHARMMLAKASTFASDEEQVRQARLAWQDGGVSLAEGDAGRAETLLRASREGLKKQANPFQEALVSIDLVQSLLVQGKSREACEIASSAARFLEPFEGNPLAEAAILQLARAGIEGKLNTRVVFEVRRQLEEARPEARAR